MLHVTKASGLQGTISIPGDKSISHRAIMLGSLARGRTEIHNFLTGEDCLSTARCFRAMGIEMEGLGSTTVTVHGKGLEGLTEPEDVLDVGNSGTTMRLMLGILAGQRFFAAATGDRTIRRRPMGRVTRPLAEMGAKIWGREGGTLAPLAIQGENLRPIHYQSTVASAQVKSSILLAGLYCDGATSVEEPVKSRDHTERMLRYFGGGLQEDGNRVTVTGRPDLQGRKVTVPGDISSAAFFLVAASIVPNSELLVQNVGINPTRDGILEVLEDMGAGFELLNQREESGEPVADILVRSSSLKGVTIGGDIIPRLIDEIPVLAVAAAMAEGETVIKDAQELKVKETNRIVAVVNELSKFGVQVEERPDGLRILGGTPLKGARCQSYHDHRMAMSMAVAGLVAEGETVIENPECINISFPGFTELLKGLTR